MSDRTLQAQITAVDKASPVFAQVAQGAQRMGTAIQQSAQKTNQSLRDNTQAVNDLKIGTAALAAGFTLAARAAQDQARQQDAIARLYGESANEIEALSEAIQDNTRFSNDQARQAAITGSTLAQNYELSAEQIGVLIERSADLAQVHGVTLTDAMSRVAGAIRGEGEAAELLGLNMSDSAVAAEAAARGIDNWTTTATEAEKAAFRYQLVIEQTTATQGAAADAADTTAGKIAHLANEVQDAAVGFAEWTGPIGEVTAALSAHALEITVVGGGLVKFTQGIRAAGIASKAASLAMGPVGLVAAAGAAAFALYEVIQAFDAANLSAAEAKVELDEYMESLAQLQKTGGSPEAVSELAAQRAVIEQVVLASEEARKKIEFANIAVLNAAEEEREASARGDSAAAAAANQRVEAARQYVKELERTIIDQKQLNQLTEDLFEIYTDPNPLNFDLVLARLAELDAQLAAGTITNDEYIKQVHQLNEESDSYGLTIEQIAAGSRNYVGAATAATAATIDLTAASERAAAALTFQTGEYEAMTVAIAAAELAEERRLARVTERSTVALDAEMKERAALQGLIDIQEERTLVDAGYAAVAQRGVEMTERQTLALEKQNRVAEQLSRQTDVQFAGMQVQSEDLNNLRAYNEALRENETALDRVARGSSSVAVQMAAFKQVQDGLIAGQDVYNQQYSEYGSQISAIERAQEVLNRRREEGEELSQSDLDFLEQAGPALERLEGGQDDAAVSAGKLAAQYGENMTTGDKLNETLSGMDKTTGALTEAINDLILALGGVPEDTKATLDVEQSGLGAQDIRNIRRELMELDGKHATAYVTTVNQRVGFQDPALRDGGIVGHEFARVGLVTPGLRAVTVGEAGPETVLLPAGARVRNAAATAATPVSNGVVVNMHIGNVHGMGQFEEAISEMTRLVRARFAGLGM